MSWRDKGQRAGFMLPQRGTLLSIVSFVRGIVKAWECGLRGLGRGKGGSQARAGQVLGRAWDG